MLFVFIWNKLTAVKSTEILCGRGNELGVIWGRNLMRCQRVFHIEDLPWYRLPFVSASSRMRRVVSYSKHFFIILFI